MDSGSSAGDDDYDLDLVGATPSPSSSFSSPGDPFDDFYGEEEEYPPHSSEPSEVDRLSHLPNQTLIQIISLLTTKDAIKTSLLSTRFRSLYSLSHTLSFHPPHSDKTRFNLISFINSVDQTLILHNSPKLNNLHLEFEYDDVSRPSVDRWISYAVRRQVEEIVLDFFGCRAICGFDGIFYQLPISLLSCSCLVKLSLTCVRFGDSISRTTIRWDSLKCLSLGYVKLDEGLISSVLSSCPVLEDLQLRECSGFNRLRIGFNLGLKKLGVYGYGEFCKEMDLEIYAPKIESLCIYGSFHRNIRLMDVVSATDVALNCRFLHHGNRAAYSELVVQLLVSVRCAKYLALGSWCIQVLSNRAVTLPALVANCLTLETCFDKWEIPGIRRLMEVSCFLEKLVLNIHPFGTFQSHSKIASDFDISEADKTWNLQNVGSFVCLQSFLKTVWINGFTGRQFELAFAQFILGHALMIEKMAIHCGKTEHLKGGVKHLEEEELLEVVRKILSFKRASAKAVILLFE